MKTQRTRPKTPREKQRTTCSRCGRKTPPDQFAKAGKTPAGSVRRSAICKTCDAERYRERCARDGDRIRQRRRELRDRPEERARRATLEYRLRRRETYRRARARRPWVSTPEIRAANAIAVEKYRAKRPEVVRAHQITAWARRVGLLEYGARCSTPLCNGIPVHMHHADYDQPLRVTAVCRRCHEEIHHYGRPMPGATTVSQERSTR